MAVASSKSQTEKRTGFSDGQNLSADGAVVALLAYSGVVSSLA